MLHVPIISRAVSPIEEILPWTIFWLINKIDIKTNKNRLGTVKHFILMVSVNIIAILLSFFSVQIVEQVYGNARHWTNFVVHEKKIGKASYLVRLISWKTWLTSNCHKRKGYTK